MSLVIFQKDLSLRLLECIIFNPFLCGTFLIYLVKAQSENVCLCFYLFSLS